MKLVTFQSLEAFKFLVNYGYLETNEKYIDMEKSNPTYSYICERMSNKVKNPTNAPYPLWCWVKCHNSICPPKHKGTKVEGFDIKITFHKKDDEVFVTDYIKFSFLLNNMYIPLNKKDKEQFEQELKKYNITKEELKAYVRKDKYESHRTDSDYLKICEKIHNSFERCITNEGEILQGCIWRLNIDEIESIEILNDNNYCYGSLNYLRTNGQRKNWIEEYYKTLK